MPSDMSLDSEAQPQPGDGLPAPRRYWALFALYSAISMTVIDSSIANVALPSMVHELGVSPSASIWIVNAYQLTIVMTVLSFSALAERFGYRRIYMVGVSIFTAASLVCALSNNLTQLVAGRVLQGLGGAGALAITAAMVRFIFPHRMLGRGFGLNAMVAAVASGAGPSVASAILSMGNWHWLFAVNVPLGIMAVAVGARTLPNTPGSGKRYDWVSGALAAAAFGLVILGAEGLAREGSPQALAELLVGLAAGFVLVRRERAVAAPLLPLDLLRIPMIRLTLLTVLTAFTAQGLALVSLPFHFQSALHRSVVETGLLITPWPVAAGLVGAIAGRLADRYPAGILCSIGLALLTVGLLLIASVGPEASDLDIAWRMALCGVGFGFFQAPNNRALVDATPIHRSGVVGGALAVSRLSGQVFGASLIAVVFHYAGTRAAPYALAIGAIAAALASIASLSRMRITPPREGGGLA
jgi:DHA2 family multidrug resistance protein-like MFS transporter